MYLSANLLGLQKLDGGKLAAAFEHEMRQAVKDCMDRPGDKKPRTVTMQVKLIPVIDQTGDCATCQVAFDVAAKLPRRKTRNYEFLAKRNGDMLFSENSPTNPFQRTFDDQTEQLADAALPEPDHE